jgi:hypothetical protein
MRKSKKTHVVIIRKDKKPHYWTANRATLACSCTVMMETL